MVPRYDRVLSTRDRRPERKRGAFQATRPSRQRP
jgi:hypothetical protein